MPMLLHFALVILASFLLGVTMLWYTNKLVAMIAEAEAKQSPTLN